ncbi:MAG: EVE domain-containing protein [Deltaproteobacteria bacterium]|nr:EVE domain-containing protein [Deltaproteobacteria bacterium]
MNYWLVKSEPFKYSYDDLVRDKKTFWDGVRNYQARNNLRAMKKGDQVFFYHSNEGKEIIGICEVAKEAYPDPTAKEGDWSVVDVKAKKKFKTPVTLKQIKDEPKLADVALIKQSRLSVMPIEKKHYDLILRMAS